MHCHCVGDSGRSSASQAVNQQMVHYWQISRLIVEQEQQGHECVECGRPAKKKPDKLVIGFLTVFGGGGGNYSGVALTPLR
jgi:hypothetical protein